MKKDNRLMILLASTVAIIIIATILGIVLSDSGVDAQSDASLSLLEKSYDFGTISMADGNVSHSFEIKNTGGDVLEIDNINTSCMCTSAVFEKDGEKSPSFGMEMHGTNPKFWSAEVNPGETANLIVIFDPAAHGPSGVGQITRTVSLYSNDPLGKIDVRFSAEVTP